MRLGGPGRHRRRGLSPATPPARGPPPEGRLPRQKFEPPFSAVFDIRHSPFCIPPSLHRIIVDLDCFGETYPPSAEQEGSAYERCGSAAARSAVSCTALLSGCCLTLDVRHITPTRSTILHEEDLLMHPFHILPGLPLRQCPRGKGLIT